MESFCLKAGVATGVDDGREVAAVLQEEQEKKMDVYTFTDCDLLFKQALWIIPVDQNKSDTKRTLNSTSSVFDFGEEKKLSSKLSIFTVAKESVSDFCTTAPPAGDETDFSAWFTDVFVLM